jgi:glycosyltransferase involved in cell wall biosynthesis
MEPFCIAILVEEPFEMRILIVASHYYPAFEYGGPIFSLHALSKAMADKGVEVTVYTTNACLEGVVPVDKEVDLEGIKVTYFSRTRLLDFMGSRGWQHSFTLTRSLRKYTKSFDLVYILGVWSYPVLAAAHYSRKYDKPYFISPRGTLYPETLCKKWWKKVLYFRAIIKRYMQRASIVHYTSLDEARCHALLGLSSSTLVLPNGIDLSLFVELSEKQSFEHHYPQLKGKRVILFLGRLVWKKGLDILLGAYKEIAQQRSDVHLVIAGNDEGNFGSEVRQWAKNYGLSKRVTFTGMLAGARKLEAYYGSDVFVLPSYSENFGMTVVEAMACGLPVVISDKVGIHAEVKGANAGVIVECDKKSVYYGMISVLNDSNLAHRLAVNGIALVRDRYDIQKIAAGFIDVCARSIEKCASGTKRRFYGHSRS